MVTDREKILGKIMNTLVLAGVPIHEGYIRYMADYILSLGFEPDSIEVGFENGNVAFKGVPKEGFTPVHSEDPIDIKKVVKDVTNSGIAQPEKFDMEKVLKDIFGDENVKIIHAEDEDEDEDEDSPLSIVSSEFTDEECTLDANTTERIFKLFKETYEERIDIDSVDKLYKLNGTTNIIINGIDSFPKALGFLLAMFENCHYEEFPITYAQVMSWAVRYTNLSNDHLEVFIPHKYLSIFEYPLN